MYATSLRIQGSQNFPPEITEYQARCSTRSPFEVSVRASAWVLAGSTGAGLVGRFRLASAGVAGGRTGARASCTWLPPRRLKQERMALFLAAKDHQGEQLTAFVQPALGVWPVEVNACEKQSFCQVHLGIRRLQETRSSGDAPADTKKSDESRRDVMDVVDDGGLGSGVLSVDVDVGRMTLAARAVVAVLLVWKSIC